MNMNKPTFVISCAIDCYSGYSARSRDIVKSIIESDKYEVKILPQRWGNTPWNFISDHIEDWGFLNNYIYRENLTERPDVWMQITVPNEFQPVGKYNIGVTAGMETTLVDGSWVEGVNRMDLTLVSSNHSKETFLRSIFDKQDKGRPLGTVKVNKPIEVLFEGVDINTYFPCKSTFNLEAVKEQFSFLFVGHWMQGNMGEDRKNVGFLIKAFYETFKNKKSKPALILKTSGSGSSIVDKDIIEKKIYDIKKTVNSSDLPNVYLLHGEFTDKEMNELYNHQKVKAMVSLTKGEGFGRPLLEFTTTKKPLITTSWSGHTDFLDPTMTTLLNGSLKPVDRSAVIKGVIIPESSWFNVDPASVGKNLKECFTHYKKYLKGARKQARKSTTEFSYEKMSELLDSYLTKNIPEFPKQIQIKLPELPKLKLPTIS